MKFQRFDTVRLRSLPILSDFTVGSVDGGTPWCSVEIAGHMFFGHINPDDLFLVEHNK